MSVQVPRASTETWRSPTACEIADAVWSVHRSYQLVCGLASAESAGQLRRRRMQVPEDRREEERATVCIPVEVTPVITDESSVVAAGPPIAGVTRDLSSIGVGLRHDRELATKFAVAEFDVFGEPVRLLFETRWTREESEHAYHSGGRFVAVVDPAKMIGVDG